MTRRRPVPESKARVKCPDCDGAGWYEGSSGLDDRKWCTRCKGVGKVRAYAPVEKERGPK